MNLYDAKEHLNKKGYFFLKSFFSEEKLINISNIANSIVEKSKKNLWKHIKVYRDYYPFFNNINIFGVDYPLNKDLNDSTFEEFQKLDYKKNLLETLEWKDFNTTLVRLHTNSSFYNYQGEWHRDDSEYPSPHSIQAIIYLQDEEGYRIVPKNKNSLLKKYNISTDSQIDEDNSFVELPRDMYDIITAKKGDILFHQSGLLHQGFCKKKRLHFHLRHIKSDTIQNSDNKDIFNFTEPYSKNFDLNNVKVNHNSFNKNLIIKTIRLKTFLLYFFPRVKSILNNLINSKNRQTIFHSTFWQ